MIEKLCKLSWVFSELKIPDMATCFGSSYIKHCKRSGLHRFNSFQLKAMRTSVIISALLGLAIVGILTPRTEAQGVADLVGGLTGGGLVEALTSRIVGLWRTGDIVFLDHVCSFQVKPKLRKLQLYFDGTFWCPGWTPIKGEALTRSNSSVVNKAVQDFLQKALASGLITESEARAWLKQ
ncbi:anti-lipopolysaccharide factor-like [Macrobrachium rosenbergii]